MKTVRPKFTRQHYVEIAKLVSLIENKSDRKMQAVAYCEKFASDNPRFSHSKFLAACGVESC